MINKIQKMREQPLSEKLWKLLTCRRHRVQPTKTNRVDDLLNDELQSQLRLDDIQHSLRPSLNYFEFEGRMRQACLKIATHRFFEWGMLVIIILSTVQLALDNPLNDPNSSIVRFLNILDINLTSIFALEAAVKIIAFGFAKCGSRSYIRSLWNQLDFVIVIISIVSTMLPTSNLQAIKIVRLMKVLRPLRVISRNEGLKISIRALGVALPGIFDVIVVLFIFIFICGVIGVNYFKGRFFDCDYSIFETEGDPMNSLGYQIDTKWDCVNSGAEWKN